MSEPWVTTSGRRRVKLYQSLIRPHLLMGAERTAVLLNAAVAILVYFLTLSIPGIFIAIGLFTVVQAVLILLAKNDHQMIAILGRSKKYQPFYGDGSHLAAPYRPIPAPPDPIAQKVVSLFNKRGKNAKHQGISQQG